MTRPVGSKDEESSHRLHKVKHLPLLDLLHLEDVLQRNFVEMLPHVIHLVVCLRREGGGDKRNMKGDGRNLRSVTDSTRRTRRRTNLVQVRLLLPGRQAQVFLQHGAVLLRLLVVFFLGFLMEQIKHESLTTTAVFPENMSHFSRGDVQKKADRAVCGRVGPLCTAH